MQSRSLLLDHLEVALQPVLHVRCREVAWVDQVSFDECRRFAGALLDFAQNEELPRRKAVAALDRVDQQPIRLVFVQIPADHVDPRGQVKICVAPQAIFGQRFEPARNPLGDEFRINTYLADDQKYPAVAMLPGGKFITVWQSMGQDGSNFGIFGEIGPKAGSADITHNGFVDFLDFSRLAQEWLKKQNPLTADLIDDNKIDELDLAAFCDQWLTPCYDCSGVDLNDDTQIDFIDYSRWAGDWLKQGPNLTGDITSDGFADFLDLKPIFFHWATFCQ